MTSDALIRIMCPNLSCQRILAVPVVARGKIVRCRACGTNVRVPPGRQPGGPPQPGSRPHPGADTSDAGAV